MNPRDPNLEKVELIANALGPLNEELVYIGGCAAGLLITDPAAAPVRVTYDVDLLVQVSALRDYHRLEVRIAKLGFVRDMSKEGSICRWHYGNFAVDLMPTDARVLGFGNRWYPFAVETAVAFKLPRGATIRLIAAPVFIATKCEAFADRGGEDVLGSHDLEDIINIVDGRPELVGEIERTETQLRTYLAQRCAALLAMPNFHNYLPGMLAPGETPSDRVADVSARLQRIAAMGT